MPDTTITLEHAIVRTLLRAGGTKAELTVHGLLRRLTNAAGTGPSWRQVASTVTRLERDGYLTICDHKQIGDYYHPLFALTDAGVGLARQSQQLRPMGLEEFRRGESA